MTGRHSFILLFFIVITDLVYSTPKLLNIKRAGEYRKLWARQGLPYSVEDTENPDNQEQLHAENQQVNHNINNENDVNRADIEPNLNDDNAADDDFEGAQEENQQEGSAGNNDENDDGDQENQQDPAYDGNENELDSAQGESLQNDRFDQSADGQNEENDGNLDPDTHAEFDDEYDQNALGYLDVMENQEYDSKEYVNLDSAAYEDDDNDEIINLQGNRALQVGDTFTAQEMLPIAKKLMRKVRDRKSAGKGIVSSAIKPKNLADILFERYFMTMKRIVILKDIDIPGLDALQALALSGEAAGLRSAANSVTESPANKRGEHLFEKNPIRKCHYKLLRKSTNGKGRIQGLKKNAKRRRVDLSKKLAKKRKLLVNSARRGPSVTNKNRKTKPKGKVQNSKKPNITINSQDNRGIKRTQIHKTNGNKKISNRSKNGKSKVKSLCRWRYECTDQRNLETCRLHTDCSEAVKSDKKYLGLKLNQDEHTETLKQFRRTIGVDVIDDEVEKILEIRLLALRPPIYPNEQIESIAEYFNKIVVREQLDALHSSPRPMGAPIDVAEKSDEDSTVLISVTEAYENQDSAGLLEPPQDDPGDNHSEIRQDDLEDIDHELENDDEIPQDEDKGDSPPENEDETPQDEDEEEPHPENEDETPQDEDEEEPHPENEDETPQDEDEEDPHPENEDETLQDKADDPTENENEFTPEPVQDSDASDDDETGDLVPVPEVGDSVEVTSGSLRRILPGVLTTVKPK